MDKLTNKCIDNFTDKIIHSFIDVSLVDLG